jgi:chromosome segregation ATPase
MLTWVQKYSSPLLVVVAIIIASLWVHDHTQQAVERALVQQYADSVTIQAKRDSVNAAARDSVLRVSLAQKAADEAAARAFATAAHAAMHAAVDLLQSAKSAADSIGLYQVALQHADSTITQQANAITAANAQIVTLQAQVLDRDGQIASLRASNADLVDKLKKASKSGLFSGTTFTIVKTVLAAKGAYDVFKGH